MPTGLMVAARYLMTVSLILIGPPLKYAELVRTERF